MLGAGLLYRLPGESSGIRGDDEFIEAGGDELVFDRLQPVAELEHLRLIHGFLACAGVTPYLFASAQENAYLRAKL
jgi:hypothetical protein